MIDFNKPIIGNAKKNYKPKVREITNWKNFLVMVAVIIGMDAVLIISKIASGQ